MLPNLAFFTLTTGGVGVASVSDMASGALASATAAIATMAIPARRRAFIFLLYGFLRAWQAKLAQGLRPGYDAGNSSTVPGSRWAGKRREPRRRRGRPAPASGRPPCRGHPG